MDRDGDISDSDDDEQLQDELDILLDEEEELRLTAMEEFLRTEQAGSGLDLGDGDSDSVEDDDAAASATSTGAGGSTSVHSAGASAGLCSLLPRRAHCGMS